MTKNLNNLHKIGIILFCAFVLISFQYKSGDTLKCDGPKPRNILDCSSPLDQFLIKDFLSFYFNIGFNIKFLFTNMSFYLIIVTFMALILNVIYNKLNTLISNF